ncbi:MAG TPA: nuclear transport factor 2 family protein [Solirubrobacterales bacterium]|nr:nuclear transport factor 2 family protein [Solirubrobacterales bacterium]
MAQTVSPAVLDQFKERFECWNRGELDLMQNLYAEDAVWDISGVFTDVAPMQGHESLRRYWDEVWETWEGVRMDPLAVFDVGDGRYVVDVRLWGKGKRSGVEVDQRFAYLYTLRPEDEKIIRAQLLPDVQSAVTVAESSAP